jgi:hypothetical protein
MEYVIQINEAGDFISDPVSLSNFGQLYYWPGDYPTIPYLKDKGYAPFQKTPEIDQELLDNPYKKVADHGFNLDSDGWVRKVYSIEDKTNDELNETLEELKEYERLRVRDYLRTQLRNPVEVNGISWNGDMGSIQRLVALKSILDASADSTMSIYDWYNEPNEMTSDQIASLISELNTNLQVKLAEKQAKLVEIDNAADADQLAAIEIPEV